MITVPAHKVRQFGVEFYQTSFTSEDIQKLVKFEVLSYSAAEEEKKKRKTAKTSAINWEMLEKLLNEVTPEPLLVRYRRIQYAEIR